MGLGPLLNGAEVALLIMPVRGGLVLHNPDGGGIYYHETDAEAETGCATLPAPVRIEENGLGLYWTDCAVTYPALGTISSPIFSLNATYTDPPTATIIQPDIQPQGTSVTGVATKGDGSPFSDGDISDFKYTITLNPSPDGLRTPYVYGARFNFEPTHQIIPPGL